MNATASADALRAAAPSVQFPVTLCVLCYGPNASLAERFLASLYSTTDPALFQLRAGLNEVEDRTFHLFETFQKQHRNISILRSPANLYKSRMMRRLFHETPLASNWTIWCDDDSHFTRADWLHRLALKIEHHPGAALWGWLHYFRTRDDSILDWIRQAAWYQGRPFGRGTDPDGQPATEFLFPTGGFWAIRTEILRRLDWPDPRLVQGADDILLAEALRQNHLHFENFHHGVAINDAPRRNPEAKEHSILNRSVDKQTSQTENAGHVNIT